MLDGRRCVGVRWSVDGRMQEARAARDVVVSPSAHCVAIAQDRIREKRFISGLGLSPAPYAEVHAATDLNATAISNLLPGVLKISRFGYDGKGQVRIKAPEEASAAWASLKTDEAVLEGFIDFERELSIIAVRTEDGQFTHYGLVENQHKNHILDLTIAPAPHSAARSGDRHPFGARTTLSKCPLCEPSQNGLFAEWPHRQRLTAEPS